MLRAHCLTSQTGHGRHDRASGAAGGVTESADRAAKVILTNATASRAAGFTRSTDAAATCRDANAYRLVANPAGRSPPVGKKLDWPFSRRFPEQDFLPQTTDAS